MKGSYIFLSTYRPPSPSHQKPLVCGSRQRKRTESGEPGLSRRGREDSVCRPVGVGTSTDWPSCANTNSILKLKGRRPSRTQFLFRESRKFVHRSGFPPYIYTGHGTLTQGPRRRKDPIAFCPFTRMRVFVTEVNFLLTPQKQQHQQNLSVPEGDSVLTSLD